MHDLDLLVHQDVGQLDRGVVHGVFDDLVRELVAGPIERVGLEALSQLDHELGHVRELADRSCELVVGLGHDLAAQLLHRHLEVGRLAAQRLFLVVVREDDVELALTALGEADQVLLEARDEVAFAQDQRHAARTSRPRRARRRGCPGRR